MTRKSQLLSSGDHLPQQLVDSVGVHAGALGNTRAQLSAHAAQEARRWRRICILRLVGEYAAQVLVVVGRPAPGEIVALLSVVLCQRAPQLAEGLCFALGRD